MCNQLHPPINSDQQDASTSRQQGAGGRAEAQTTKCLSTHPVTDGAPGGFDSLGGSPAHHHETGRVHICVRLHYTVPPRPDEVSG